MLLNGDSLAIIFVKIYCYWTRTVGVIAKGSRGPVFLRHSVLFPLTLSLTLRLTLTLNLTLTLTQTLALWRVSAQWTFGIAGLYRIVPRRDKVKVPERFPVTRQMSTLALTSYIFSVLHWRRLKTFYVMTKNLSITHIQLTSRHLSVRYFLTYACLSACRYLFSTSHPGSLSLLIYALVSTVLSERI